MAVDLAELNLSERDEPVSQNQRAILRAEGRIRKYSVRPALVGRRGYRVESLQTPIWEISTGSTLCAL